jgi:hypothetical protein
MSKLEQPCRETGRHAVGDNAEVWDKSQLHLDPKCIMKRTRRSILILACYGFQLLAAGCGSRREPPPKPEAQADAKVNAIKRLADAMAREPDGAEARGALEDFRNTPFDARKHPEHADEIVAVYRERIEGKYQGFVADEIRMEVGPLLTRPK